MNAPADKQVDHINGDKLDNRRANLRLCTRSQNAYNRGADAKNTTGHKGVSRNGRYWQANIYADIKRRFLGNFKTLDDAVDAYHVAAVELHGRFAYCKRTKSGTFTCR